MSDNIKYVFGKHRPSAVLLASQVTTRRIIRVFSDILILFWVEIFKTHLS